MNKMALSITVLSLFTAASTHAVEAKNNTYLLDTYNVVWHSQSKDSSESMPVGGGDACIAGGQV